MTNRPEGGPDGNRAGPVSDHGNMRRALAAHLFALVALLLSATPAGAHVELEPGEAVAGSEATLTFSFHHGKDGSATTGIEVLLPTGASVIEIPPVDGWSSTIDPEAGTVRWTGGTVPDGTEAAFPVVVQLPPEPGVVLFKTVQTTEAGELAWIDEAEGDDEGTNSAPRLTLVADPAPTTTEAPTTTAEDTAVSTTQDRQPGTTLEAEERNNGDDSLAPWLIGSAIAAVVAIGVGGTLLKRRTC